MPLDPGNESTQSMIMKSLPLLTFVFGGMMLHPMAQDLPIRQTLSSATHSIHLEEWSAESDTLTPNGYPTWSIQKTTLHGGKQENVDQVVLRNGILSITVIPTRGMSILKVESAGLNLEWQSPVKEIVHPGFINLQERGGLGWLEGFNEWMVRCGLEFAGHPGKDEFINNVGDKATMDLTLHGKIGNIPASEVEAWVEPGPPAILHLRGKVSERMFYGPQFDLWTEITLAEGASHFTLTDTVTHHGAYPQEMQLIYHANFGPPLLEKGAQLVAPLVKVTPFNSHAAKSIGQYSVYDAPTPGFIEQVYCLRPLADSNGNTSVLLKNASGDKGVSFSYSLQALPYLTLWKNTAPLEAGYVTGIEPGTGFPYNRRVERHYDRVPKLNPGESRSFALTFEILNSRSQVQRVESTIQKIQGQRRIEISDQPEANPATLFPQE